MNGVAGGAEKGVPDGGGRGVVATVALSKPRNDSAATGAKSLWSRAKDDSRFACSVSTS